MQTNFEQFALTSMLGHEDSPPRLAGKLCFGEEWQRTAFGIALALSKSGYFDWSCGVEDDGSVHENRSVAVHNTPGAPGAKLQRAGVNGSPA